MDTLSQGLAMALDLLLVIIGFGLIIFVHELGHFLAARWAGIRVLAFAIGFGPALFSFRKGWGMRPGTTEARYNEAMRRAGPAGLGKDVSPTEYRLNILPLGGYVKMLGQDDTDPTAVSTATDSYQNAKPWKRMVVISAGVVMNIITAALLFVLVFMVGLKTEAPIVGALAPGSPAALARADNTPQGVEDRLLPGDRVLTIGGDEVHSFNDIVLGVAMAPPNRPVELVALREGVNQPLRFNITPRAGQTTGLLDLGLDIPHTTTLFNVQSDAERKLFADITARFGIQGVEPGAALTRVDGRAITTFAQFIQLVRNSNGRPLDAEFTNPNGKAIAVSLRPRPQLQQDQVARAPGTFVLVDHLLGLVPVARVADAGEAAKKGLQSGDIFVRAGDAEFPSTLDFVRQVKARAGDTIKLVVLRKGEADKLDTVELPAVKVERNGTIGFTMGDVGDDRALFAMPLPQLSSPTSQPSASAQAASPGASLISAPGTQILTVNGLPVANFAQLREVLRVATRDAHLQNTSATLDVVIRRPAMGLPAHGDPETVRWTLEPEAIDQLHALAWLSPLPASLFEPLTTLRKADNPGQAVGMGIHETKRAMLNVYVTFARLAQGTVKVEHLKGPVGIAHLGTLIASKGLIWLLFFMALISVNLAVINFLPLPIVDGGQFLFILYEQIRGRPVPIPVQNAVTMVGLVMLGLIFLVVTYNDIANLIR